MSNHDLKETKVIKTPSVYPIYCAGVGWVLVSLFAPMYRISGLILCAVAAVLGYGLGTKIFPPKEEIVEIIKEEEYASEAIRQTVEEGVRMLDELKAVNVNICHANVSQQIDEIEAVAAEILNTVKKQPESVGSIRKWMNYYLPTTLKLLKQYAELEKQTTKGSNVQESMEKIEKMMNLVVTAFHKQLDNLFEGEAMDISSEITVMEGMMASEGLIEDDLPLKGGSR